MIFNDDTTLNYQQRVIETLNYLKYCQHKSQKLQPAERLSLLRYCMMNRVSRMPDENKKVLSSIQKLLVPENNLSAQQSKISEVKLSNEDLKTLINSSKPDSIHTPVTKDDDDKIDIDFEQCTGKINYQKSLNDILAIFYDATTVISNEKTGTHKQLPDPQQVEEIIGTLLLVANRLNDTEYRLIDVLPQLGEAFEAREEIIEGVINNTVNKMFDLMNIDKFQEVKLKSSLNTPVKRKAFLFDLVSQNFQRIKNQHDKGVFRDEALELYRQKLKSLGIS